MTSAASPDQPTIQPLPPSPTPSRRLHRSARDRMLGGVCGGLAEYSGVDVVLWRVGFVALALMGAGVLAYLLLWVVMPAAPEATDGPFESTVQRLHTALNDGLGPRNRG